MVCLCKECHKLQIQIKVLCSQDAYTMQLYPCFLLIHPHTKIYNYANVCTYEYTYIQTCVHAHIHTCIQTFMHNIYKYIATQVYTSTATWIHTYRIYRYSCIYCTLKVFQRNFCNQKEKLFVGKILQLYACILILPINKVID